LDLTSYRGAWLSIFNLFLSFRLFSFYFFFFLFFFEKKGKQEIKRDERKNRNIKIESWPQARPDTVFVILRPFPALLASLFPAIINN